MNPKIPWKALSKGGTFSTKQAAFLVAAGLVVVVGIALRASHYFGEPAGEEKAPVAVEASPPEAPPPAVETTETVPKTPPATQEAATPPSEPAEQAGDAAEQAGNAAEQGQPEGGAVEQAEQPLPDPGMILVARKPVELLASPSSEATVMFGFPAGRPFRVIGQEGGFAHIRDLKSGATGWIDKAALAPPPKRAVAAPPKSKSGTGGRKPAKAAAKPKPQATKDDAQVATDSDSGSVQPRSRPGLFGQGGLFGGIFSGGN